MANIFNSVMGLHPKRNAFSAHTYRNDFTAPLGVNLPVYLQEVPPATRAMVSTSALVRLQALIAPVMDNIDYYVHFWKLPYRIIEDDRFTAFISGEIEGAEYDALFATPAELAEAVAASIGGSDSEEIVFIYNAIFGNGSLMDFLGYDVDLFPEISAEDESPFYSLSGGNDSTELNWRGLIAYFMLHENWYMNENVPYFDDFVEKVKEVVTEQKLSTLASLMALTAKMHGSFSCSFLPHAWEKDYFTSALPNVQNGSPVQLPIATNADVIINPGQIVDLQGAYPVDPSTAPLAFTMSGGAVGDHPDLTSVVTEQGESSSEGFLRNKANETIDGVQGYLNASLAGKADLSTATAITINELRFANALQVFKERQMRYGRRRQEYYKGFFDVSPEDLRLQIPKYLGGGRIPINISDIEQTSETSGSQALGRLAGKGTAVAGGFAGFTTFCSEESVIIGIAFSMPHITYAKQVSRFKLKTNDIYDYFNPSFEHLGEQAVKNIEVYSGATEPDGDFGYQPRYTEYRFHSNEMHGAFKDSLSFWSLGRIFDSQPALNADFVYMQPAVFDRIFAVSGQPNMIVSMLFKVRLIQPVSKYGTPMLLA